MKKYQILVKEIIELIGGRQKTAEFLGKTKQYICLMEHGHFPPSLRTALLFQKLTKNKIKARDLNPNMCKGLEGLTFKTPKK